MKTEYIEHDNKIPYLGLCIYIYNVLLQGDINAINAIVKAFECNIYINPEPNVKYILLAGNPSRVSVSTFCWEEACIYYNTSIYNDIDLELSRLYPNMRVDSYKLSLPKLKIQLLPLKVRNKIILNAANAIINSIK